jgi:rubredoxin
VKDSAAHTPGAEPTETTAQTCTTCGYIIKAALGHKHDYASAWTTDEAGHWYACPGCEEKGSYAAHDFENACDLDCSICGFTRETEHTFDDEWSTDKTNHWHECSGCGLKQDEAAHEPGAEATATTAQTCTICGYEIALALGAEESTEPTDDTNATAPTVPTDKNDPEEGTFLWWIIVVVAVVAAGGVAAVIVIKKKKR